MGTMRMDLGEPLRGVLWAHHSGGPSGAPENSPSAALRRLPPPHGQVPHGQVPHGPVVHGPVVHPQFLAAVHSPESDDSSVWQPSPTGGPEGTWAQHTHIHVRTAQQSAFFADRCGGCRISVHHRMCPHHGEESCARVPWVASRGRSDDAGLEQPPTAGTSPAPTGSVRYRGDRGHVPGSTDGPRRRDWCARCRTHCRTAVAGEPHGRPGGAATRRSATAAHRAIRDRYPTGRHRRLRESGPVLRRCPPRSSPARSAARRAD